MKKFLSIPIFLVATLFLIYGTSSYFTKDSEFNNKSIERTIANNKVIQNNFDLVANYLENYYSEEHKYPTQIEYDSWADSLPEMKYDLKKIDFFTKSNTFPNEAIDRFGEPQPNTFILAMWRGEWFEYYASWLKMSTLSFDPEAYKPTLYNLFVMLFFSAILYFVAVLLLSKGLQAKIKAWLETHGYRKPYLAILRIKPYIITILTWVSSGIVLGLLFAIGGGVGPGSYLIMYGVIILSCIAAFIHCLILLFSRT